MGWNIDQHSPQPQPIADEYAHYPTCEHAVIEHEGSGIDRAIRQVDWTVRELLKIGKTPKLGILVLKQLSTQESGRYKWSKQTHELKVVRGGKQQDFPNIGTIKLKWYLFYKHQVREQWEQRKHGIEKYLPSEDE